MSGTIIDFMGQMFVDDTNILVTHPELDLAKEVMEEAHASVDGWGLPLTSTGGALNGDKCYWFMVDYVCNGGIWSYAKTDNDLHLEIPLADGKRVRITQEEITVATKMLGIWACLVEGDTTHITKNVVDRMKDH